MCNENILKITTWSRVLPEKPRGPPQVVKKYPAVYGNLRFITAPTRVRHFSIT
jgi:hypothetical protein